jgi:uncharacterized protein (TIGR03437 family)
VPPAATGAEFSAGGPRGAGCTATQLIPVPISFGANFNISAGWPTPLELRVVDDCASFTSTGSLVASFSNGDLPISLAQQGDSRWAATWAPRNSAANVTLTVQAKSKDLTLSGSAVFSGAVAVNPSPPVISEGGVLNGASFAAQGPLAPGSFVTLFGSKLAQGQLLAPSVPLPTTLSGSRIVIAGREVPIFFTSDGQVNAIIPYGIPVNAVQQVIAQRELAISVPEPVNFAAAAPGIFSYGDSLGIILGVNSTTGAQTFADSSNPVTAGQTIVIYCTGLGEVDPPVVAGSPTPVTQLSNTVNTVRVIIGSQPAAVAFAGLTPGSTGLYQVNAVVPSGVTPGDTVPVQLIAAGQFSTPVKISVR